jgi:hypothetical protein
VLGGTLALRHLPLPTLSDHAAARLDGRPVAVQADADGLHFAPSLRMEADTATALLEINR